MPEKRTQVCATATLLKGVGSAKKSESDDLLGLRRAEHCRKTSWVSCGLHRDPNPQERQGAECAAAVRARFLSLYVLALSTDAAPKIEIINYCTATYALSMLFNNPVQINFAGCCRAVAG